MNTHNFHFLITDKLISELYNIIELKEYSFSGKIKFILYNMDKISKFIEYINIDEKYAVSYLNKRKNVHLYIKEKLYKKIKYYHYKYNTYSIALYIREILEIFITMVKNYGFKKALKKIKKQKKVLKSICHKNKKKLIIVQLLDYLMIERDKSYKFNFILSILLL